MYNLKLNNMKVEANKLQVGEKIKSKRYGILQTIQEVIVEKRKTHLKCLSIEGIINWNTYFNDTLVEKL